MTPLLGGIHHMTAVASDPRANVRFYTGTLGLRLIKRTINYDDPGTYHLYYGDGTGSPGTILTFFPWPGAARGRIGTGQQTATALSVGGGSLPFWRERLAKNGVAYTDAPVRFGREVLTLTDPDGLPLELIADNESDPRLAWTESVVPPEHAIRGIGSVTLTETDAAPTQAMLTETLGFQKLAQEGERTRYGLAGGEPGKIVDVVHAPDAQPGLPGAGIVHHIAFRTADDAQQELWLAALREADIPVSPVRDRQYFHSIYFHEPGRVLFEIATDLPGFTTDEDAAHLGERLCLPAWLEPQRTQIEHALPPLE